LRWSFKKPRVGEKRIIKKFLFLPKTIKGETRWLEWVTIEQQYLDSPGDIIIIDCPVWIDIDWINDEKKITNPVTKKKYRMKTKTSKSDNSKNIEELWNESRRDS
jgi:hypothetical protein